MKVEEIKKYLLLFIKSNNSNKSDSNILESMMSDLDNSSPCDIGELVLEEKLKSSKGKKERHYKLLLELYDFIEKRSNISIDSDLKDYVIIDNPILRRLDIIQYLQNHKCKIEDLATRYMLDRRTLSNDLNALEDGIEILGNVVDVDLQKDKWNYYLDNSFHPIMMNLNMNEVIAMTIGLMKLSFSDSLYGPQYRRISKSIYDNLSPYAKDRIKAFMDKQKVDFHYIDEFEESECKLSSAIITMLKTECYGNIKIYHDNKDYLFINCRLLDISNEVVTLETRKKVIKYFLVNDIYYCEYYLDRQFD